MAARSDPFTPLVTSKPEHVPSESSQNVTIPHLPELFSTESFNKLLTKISAGTPAKKDPSAPIHPFADALKQTSNLTRTDNGALAFKSTGSKTLDAFSTLDPNVKKSEVHSLLRESWAEDPDTTLRIIWNLRSIHDGKASKIAFYRAFGWLYANHPKTAIANLPQLVDQVVERAPKRKKEPKSKDEKDSKGNTTTEEDEWTEVKKGDLAEPKKEEEPIVPIGMSHGYYKDLLNILLLAATDQLTHPNIAFNALSSPRPNNTAAKGGERIIRRQATQEAKAKSREEIGKEATAQKTAEETRTFQIAEAEKAKEERKQAAADVHKKLTNKLVNDNEFKALYVAVARIFARALVADAKILEKIADPTTSKEEKIQLKWQITMVGKWAPTLCGSHDRLTNIGTAIALVIYSTGYMVRLPQIRIDVPVDEADAEKVRCFYRRWIVSPLRRYSDIPEVMMSSNEWKKINYSKVPSVSFARNKLAFSKHDEDRLGSFLQDVKKGKKTISGATLGPHELVHEALRLSGWGGATAQQNETSLSIVNNQWNTMIERLREAGTLDNCLAVCDVSGSMGYFSVGPSQKLSENGYIKPIFPALSLTLVLATLAKPPFNNVFISFSAPPKIETILPHANIADTVCGMELDCLANNTDFNAVFMKLLLPLAKKHNLKRDDMVKRLFVFSDMQFDEARQADGQESWETNHESIVRAFDEAGYDMPEIVYWNLAGRASAAKPITKDTPGVSIVSGFSGNLLKLFMDKEEEEWIDVDEKGNTVIKKVEKLRMTPLDIMRKALSKKSYAGLKVLD
ncbi:hypothetical protein FRB95_012468 [Tulasnella sp. JGI-2019a]|nr:hypothetical protein FRB95_012468 [Tulasnella sp. JGI-2019a]